MAFILSGKDVKEAKQNKLLSQIATITSKGRKPCLLVIKFGSDLSSESYLKGQKKLCESYGIDLKVHQFEEDCTTNNVVSTIGMYNLDNTVDSIMIQKPLFQHLDETLINEALSSDKDVDGITVENMGRLIKKRRGCFPCTAKAVIATLDHFNIDCTSKEIVIVGRSETVGIPLFHMLLARNATVTMCHTKTRLLEEILQSADIIVVAVGSPHLINIQNFKKDVVVIDVGINFVDSKLVGDVDCSLASDSQSYSPVPGGIGVVTNVMLVENILLTYEINQEKSSGVFK